MRPVNRPAGKVDLRAGVQAQRLTEPVHPASERSGVAVACGIGGERPEAFVETIVGDEVEGIRPRAALAEGLNVGNAQFLVPERHVVELTEVRIEGGLQATDE